MRRNEILDSYNETETKPNPFFSKEMIIILTCCGALIPSYAFGDMRESCGTNSVDIILILLIILISIFGYRLIQLKFNKVKWLFIILFCSINLWTGLMYFSVIC